MQIKKIKQFSYTSLISAGWCRGPINKLQIHRRHTELPKYSKVHIKIIFIHNKSQKEVPIYVRIVASEKQWSLPTPTGSRRGFMYLPT